MATLLLVRHGETDWNRSGQIMGARPIPLNQRGEVQAETLAGFLRGYSAQHTKRSHDDDRPLPGFPPIGQDSCYLFSSPVQRALQTARVLGEALALPVQTDSGLSEIGVGAWEGRYWNELGNDPNRLRFYSHPMEARPPGGETFHEVQSRAVAALHRALNEQSSRTVILVSHADVIRAIIAHLLCIEPQQTRPMRIDHTSLTGITLSEDLPSLLFLNYVAAHF